MTFFRSIFSSFFKDLIAPFTSKATGNWKVTGETTWLQPGFPEAGDPVSIISNHIITLTRNEAAKSVSIAALAQLIMGIYRLQLSGAIDVLGNLKMGASAGDGLKAAGISFGPASVRDLLIDSIIYNSGNYTAPNADISVLSASGDYHQTNNGNCNTPHLENAFYNFTLEVTKTLTPTGISYLTWLSSNDTVINGNLNVDPFDIYLGSLAAGSLTVGANGNFSGSNDLVLGFISGATLSNARATAFSLIGNVSFPSTTTTLLIPSWDFSNADLEIKNNASAFTRIFSAGHLKFKSFTYFSIIQFGICTFDNATNDANFTCSADFTFNQGIVAANWLRGATEIITLIGGNSNLVLIGNTIGKLVVTGATKTVLSPFTTAALDVPTGGIFDLNNIGTIIVEGDLDGAGTIQSPAPVNLTVNGNNNFTGTLTNVTII